MTRSKILVILCKLKSYFILYKLYFGNKEEPKSLSIVQNISPNFIKQIDTEEIDI